MERMDGMEKKETVEERTEFLVSDSDDEETTNPARCESWEAIGGYLPRSIIKKDPPQE